jgi:insulysin
MLFDFYGAHYSSNLMKMVVYGKENVDELGNIVESQFSAIPNKNYKSYQMTEHPFDEKMFKKMVKITPVKDKRTLELTWILKDKSMHYRNSPSRYVSHILGH